MLVHLALAAALMAAATHLAPALPESPSTTSHTSAVILAVPEPDANAGEPGRCPPASAPPAYRDLSGMALIPPASFAVPETSGPRP